MKTTFIATLLLLPACVSLAKGDDSAVVSRIESGTTTKYYVGGRLHHFKTEIHATDDASSISATKNGDTITLLFAAEPAAAVRLFFIDQKQVRELRYKGKRLIYAENIDTDPKRWPPNSTITTVLLNGRAESFVSRDVYENSAGDTDRNFDKSSNLFNRLEPRMELTSIDKLFEAMAAFFSKDDALLRLFYGDYAGKYYPLKMATVLTGDAGEIIKGIIWTKRNENDGQYQIYAKRKAVLEGNCTLSQFQEILITYEENEQP